MLVCRLVWPEPASTPNSKVTAIKHTALKGRHWSEIKNLYLVFTLFHQSISETLTTPHGSTGISHVVSGPRPAWAFFTMFVPLDRFARTLFGRFSSLSSVFSARGCFGANCAFSHAFPPVHGELIISRVNSTRT